MNRVLKWHVTADDHDHPISAGEVLMVLAINPLTVAVWTLEVVDPKPVKHRRARIYATGQGVPADETYLGSARHDDSGLVWHVFGGTS